MQSLLLLGLGCLKGQEAMVGWSSVLLLQDSNRRGIGIASKEERRAVSGGKGRPVSPGRLQVRTRYNKRVPGAESAEGQLHSQWFEVAAEPI